MLIINLGQINALLFLHVLTKIQSRQISCVTYPLKRIAGRILWVQSQNILLNMPFTTVLLGIQTAFLTPVMSAQYSYGGVQVLGAKKTRLIRLLYSG